jgi:hypothetical protein
VPVRIRTAATLIVSLGLALVTAAPAHAHDYDHKDPYRTGCGDSARAVRTGTIKSVVDGAVGTIKLMWSTRCKTNWTEITTSSDAAGTIQVLTYRGSDKSTFKPGNGGRHWGNMMYANNTCAWGSVYVSWNGGRGGQKGTGATSKSCG